MGKYECIDLTVLYIEQSPCVIPFRYPEMGQSKQDCTAGTIQVRVYIGNLVKRLYFLFFHAVSLPFEV